MLDVGGRLCLVSFFHAFRFVSSLKAKLGHLPRSICPLLYVPHLFAICIKLCPILLLFRILHHFSYAMYHIYLLFESKCVPFCCCFESCTVCPLLCTTLICHLLQTMSRFAVVSNLALFVLCFVLHLFATCIKLCPILLLYRILHHSPTAIMDLKALKVGNG